VSVAGHGMFVVLEGIDGSGTTTQLGRLEAWLEELGHGVHTTFEPSDRSIGRHIRAFLRGDTPAPDPAVVALLFAADRVDHLTREINPQLTAGAHVLCDRYVGSSMAYQCLECDPDWVRTINALARTPDLTLYVRVSPETAMERINARDGARRDLYERSDLLAKISNAYDELYGVNVGAAGLDAVIIDGEAPMDDVFEACRQAINGLLVQRA
jgi:dTMP kinase